LLYCAAIRVKLNSRSDVFLNFNIAVVTLAFNDPQSFLDHLINTEFCEIKNETAGFNFGHIKYVIDHTQKIRAAFIDVFCIFPVFV